MKTTRRGLGLIEVMISLAIAAMLLTAVSAAFTASASAVENNDQFFRASQAARVSLHQLLTEIRRSHAANVSGDQIDLITHDGSDRSYIYDSANQRLMLRTNDTTTDPDYSLCTSLVGHDFSAETQTDEGGISHVIRVQVTLIVKVGPNEVRLSGAAAPRRGVTYQQ